MTSDSDSCMILFLIGSFETNVNAGSYEGSKGDGCGQNDMTSCVICFFLFIFLLTFTISYRFI